MPDYVKHLIRSERGVAAIEAALVLPVMIFFIFGTIEIYQYFRVAAILDRAAFSVADGIAMQPKLFEGGPCDATDHLCTYGVVVGDLMRPVDYKNGGRMTIRLFDTETNSGGATSWRSAPVWSRSCISDGGCSSAADGTLPAGVPPPAPKDTLVVVQVFQQYAPFVITSKFWSSLGGSTELSTTAFYRPRFEDLKSLN